MYLTHRKTTSNDLACHISAHYMVLKPWSMVVVIKQYLSNSLKWRIHQWLSEEVKGNTACDENEKGIVQV